MSPNESSQNLTEVRKEARTRMLMDCTVEFREDVEVLAILSGKSNTQEYIKSLLQAKLDENRERIEEYKQTLARLSIQEVTDGAGSRV